MRELVYILWGVTWGNNIAAVEYGVAAALTLWFCRDFFGKRIAKWWDKHHGPHAVERHKQALREHFAERDSNGS